VASAKVGRSEESMLNSQKRQDLYFYIRAILAAEDISFPITWEGDAFSSGLIRLSKGAAQTLPSVAEVKNVWSYKPNPPLLLWYVQKQTVQNVLRCDPLLYLMALNGGFQIRFY